MDNTAVRMQERSRARSDLLAGKRPDRVLIFTHFSGEAACGFAGVKLIEAHYRRELLEQAFDKICAYFYSDANPIVYIRYPPVYQLLGSRNWLLASNGAVQHPEISVMEPEDYDAFIAAPYKTIVERFIPRACAALDGDPANYGLNLAKAVTAWKDTQEWQSRVFSRLNAKYGYTEDMSNHRLLAAPFDFLSDQLRGFKGIMMDMRRIPAKVEAAAEAILPLILDLAIPPAPREGLRSVVPLHLAPYISQKQFETLYWPSFERMVLELDRRGIGCTLFAEHDWTRYADYLERLPGSTAVYFETADPARIAQTVGKNHAFGGFYNPTITLAKSREACIDEAKRLLDTCMESGRFYFTFDSDVLDIKSIDPAKLAAVLEWIRDKGRY
ncbi:MAG: hypothetical protein LBS57_11470 [Treponema sp.]|jgi:hypothetical protein|nr:hypothetical protein [Treponema sp.]